MIAFESDILKDSITITVDSAPAVKKELVGALDKHRSKRQRKVTVEHMYVNPGGQAVVGWLEGLSVSTLIRLVFGSGVSNVPETILRSSSGSGSGTSVAPLVGTHEVSPLL